MTAEPCAHARTKLWVVVQSNGAEHVRPICENCHYLLPALPKQSVGERLSALPRISYRDAVERHHEHERGAYKERERDRRAAFFAKYDEYLRSAAWRDLRSQVMLRAKATCEGCLRSAATQVHHLTYEHVFAEFAFELVAVCDDCHARLHPRHDETGEAA